MKTDVLIIGGGLSGLALACELTAQGVDFLLLEARDRFGGRILSEKIGTEYFDLGPAWFWPGQPRIAALIKKLTLTQFDQYAMGDVCFEDEHGQVQRGRGYASMQGSYRLKNGLGALTEALVTELEAKRLRLSTPVITLTRSAQDIEVKIHNGEVYSARRCVLALPPRIAAQLVFSPALPESAILAMTEIATWMAGQAKVVAIYDRPFWREAGLSGDAMSRYGPMVEIHDASPSGGTSYALFGFIGVPPKVRGDEEAMRQQILAQLGRLFGPEASKPVRLLLKDWAYDPFTATQRDWPALQAHPQYGLPDASLSLWDNCLIFAGTEVASQYGGYLEGALEAAEMALVLLLGKSGGSNAIGI